MIVNPYPSMSLEAARLWVEANPDKVMGLTSGTFDLFHHLHLSYLLRCRRECDVLIVGVDSDAEARRQKGPTRPILNEEHRLMLVNSNKHVRLCYVQDTLADFVTVAEALLGVRGGKAFRNDLFAGREEEVALGTARAAGAEVVIIPDVCELDSTSAIVRKIENNAGERVG